MTGVTTHLEDVHKAFHDLGITRYCFYPPSLPGFCAAF